MSREFLLLVLIANVLSWPLAYILLNGWLRDFAYRVSISWWVFAVTGLVVLCLSLITTGSQILRAARTNPADTLRYE